MLKCFRWVLLRRAKLYRFATPRPPLRTSSGSDTHLDGLAKARLVCQDAVQALIVQGNHPLQALQAHTAAYALELISGWYLEHTSALSCEGHFCY